MRHLLSRRVRLRALTSLSLRPAAVARRRLPLQQPLRRYSTAQSGFSNHRGNANPTHEGPIISRTNSRPIISRYTLKSGLPIPPTTDDITYTPLPTELPANGVQWGPVSRHPFSKPFPEPTRAQQIAIDAVWLSHVHITGPPGTGKSTVALMMSMYQNMSVHMLTLDRRVAWETADGRVRRFTVAGAEEEERIESYGKRERECEVLVIDEAEVLLRREDVRGLVREVMARGARVVVVGGTVEGLGGGTEEGGKGWEVIEIKAPVQFTKEIIGAVEAMMGDGRGGGVGWKISNAEENQEQELKSMLKSYTSESSEKPGSELELAATEIEVSKTIGEPRAWPKHQLPESPPLSSGPRPCLVVDDFQGVDLLFSEVERLIEKEGLFPEDILIMAPEQESGSGPGRRVVQLANMLRLHGYPVHHSTASGEADSRDLQKTSNGKIIITSYAEARGLRRKAAMVFGFDGSYLRLHEKDAATLSGNIAKPTDLQLLALTRASHHLILVQAQDETLLPFINYELLNTHFDVINDTAGPLAPWTPPRLPNAPKVGKSVDGTTSSFLSRASPSTINACLEHLDLTLLTAAHSHSTPHSRLPADRIPDPSIYRGYPPETPQLMRHTDVRALTATCMRYLIEIKSRSLLPSPLWLMMSAYRDNAEFLNEGILKHLPVEQQARFERLYVRYFEYGGEVIRTMNAPDALFLTAVWHAYDTGELTTLLSIPDAHYNSVISRWHLENLMQLTIPRWVSNKLARESEPNWLLGSTICHQRLFRGRFDTAAGGTVYLSDLADICTLVPGGGYWTRLITLRYGALTTKDLLRHFLVTQMMLAPPKPGQRPHTGSPYPEEQRTHELLSLTDNMRVRVEPKDPQKSVGAVINILTTPTSEQKTAEKGLVDEMPSLPEWWLNRGPSTEAFEVDETVQHPGKWYKGAGAARWKPAHIRQEEMEEKEKEKEKDHQQTEQWLAPSPIPIKVPVQVDGVTDETAVVPGRWVPGRSNANWRPPVKGWQEGFQFVRPASFKLADDEQQQVQKIIRPRTWDIKEGPDGVLRPWNIKGADQALADELFPPVDVVPIVRRVRARLTVPGQEKAEKKSKAERKLSSSAKKAIKAEKVRLKGRQNEERRWREKEKLEEHFGVEEDAIERLGLRRKQVLIATEYRSMLGELGFDELGLKEKGGEGGAKGGAEGEGGKEQK